jgi:hypothetical protein
MAGAVVKASYGRGKPAVGAAKAHVAYLVHRPDAWGNRQYRELWGSLDVDKQAAYAVVDRAGADGSYLYRVVLSPDPCEQDADKTLDLRNWAETVMAEAEVEHPGLRWFAVEHQDPEHRHVHVVALTRERLATDDFRAMPRRTTRRGHRSASVNVSPIGCAASTAERTHNTMPFDARQHLTIPASSVQPLLLVGAGLLLLGFLQRGR